MRRNTHALHHRQSLTPTTTVHPLFLQIYLKYREGFKGSKRGNAFTTGNPFFTNLLEVRIGRDLGTLKGVNEGKDEAQATKETEVRAGPYAPIAGRP